MKLAHLLGWKVYSQPIAKTRRPVKDATGYPDLTLVREGRVLWIELKAQDGRLSDEQLGWMLALQGKCLVIRPADFDSLGAVLS